MENNGSNPNGKPARGPGGRFGTGNPGGPGNPAAARQERFRHALLRATTLREFMAVWKTVVTAARGGNLEAAKLYLERTAGRVPVGVDLSVETAERARRERKEFEAREFQNAIRTSPEMMDHAAKLMTHYANERRRLRAEAVARATGASRLEEPAGPIMDGDAA